MVVTTVRYGCPDTAGGERDCRWTVDHIGEGAYAETERVIGTLLAEPPGG
jgi:hypothetical protein